MYTRKRGIFKRVICFILALFFVCFFIPSNVLAENTDAPPAETGGEEVTPPAEEPGDTLPGQPEEPTPPDETTPEEPSPTPDMPDVTDGGEAQQETAPPALGEEATGQETQEQPDAELFARGISPLGVTAFDVLQAELQEPGNLDIEVDTNIDFTDAISIGNYEGAPKEIRIWSAAPVVFKVTGQFRHFLTNTDTGISIVFENITLDGDSLAGGIDAQSGALALTGAHVTNCVALLAGPHGAAVHIGAGASAQIYNSTFTANSAVMTGDGGAVYAEGALAMLSGSHFERNEALSGGAVVIAGAGTENHIENCSFTGNMAGNNGGAIASVNTGNITYVSNCVLNSNMAAQGGALYNAAGNKMVADTCSMQGNSGGAAWNDGTMSVVNSTMYQNSASAKGGGICNTGTLYLVDSTLAANSAATGGAVYSEGASYMANNLLLGGVYFADTSSARNMAYNVYDVLEGEAPAEYENTNIQSTAEAEIGASPDFRASDGTLAILNDGMAANSGTFAGRIQSGAGASAEFTWYFLDIADNEWKNIADMASAGLPFDGTGAADNYGLGAGEDKKAYTDAANKIADAFVSRIQLFQQQVYNVYNAGAYALTPVLDTVVNTNADTATTATNPFDGKTTFREAVNYAAANGGTVTFAADYFYAGGPNNTITLENDELAGNATDSSWLRIATTENIAVQGLPGVGITIKAEQTYSESGGTPGRNLLHIDGAGEITFSDLTLKGGYTGDVLGVQLAGALHIEGGAAVTLNNVTVTDSGTENALGGAVHVADDSALRIDGGALYDNHIEAANGKGAAIYNEGSLTVVNSTFYGNASSGSAGAIYSDNAASTLDIISSTFYDNTDDSAAAGKAVYAAAGAVRIANSIFTGNYQTSVTTNKDDIYMPATGIIAYSAFTDSNPTPLYTFVECVRDKTPDELFGADPATPVNGAIPIIADGDAALRGALAGRVGSDWYYVDNLGATVQWVNISDSTTVPFENDADTNYGLGTTDAEVITGSQNGNSRTDTLLYYNMGAYALQTEDGTVVDTADDVLNPFDGQTTLRDAVGRAGAADTVTFAAGIAGQTIELDGAGLDGSPLGDIVISDSIVIDGEKRNITIEAAPDTSGTGNGYRVFDLNSPAAVDKEITVRIANLTLTGGSVYGYGDNSNSAGGAIRNAMHGNSAAQKTVELDSLQIVGNKAIYGSGVGVTATALEYTQTDITNCTFQNNAAETTDARGALYVEGVLSVADVTNCTFFSNQSAAYGGAMYINEAAVAVTNTTVTLNTTTEANSGAVHLYASVLANAKAVLLNNIIVGNSGGDDIINQRMDVGAAYMAYNIYGRIGDGTGVLITQPEDKGNRPGQTITDVFASNSPVLDSLGSVRITGNGTGMDGTLTGSIGDLQYYLDLADMTWKNQPADQSAPATPYAFDESDTDTYGLTGGTLTLTAQNKTGRGDPVSRVRNITDWTQAVQLAAGSYALVEDIPPVGEEIIVDTNLDVIDPYDGVTSLREALVLALNTVENAQIKFDAGFFNAASPANNTIVMTYDTNAATGGGVSASNAIMYLTRSMSITGPDDVEITVKVPVTYAESIANSTATTNYTLLSAQGAGTVVSVNNLVLKGGGRGCMNIGAVGATATARLDGVTISETRRNSSGGAIFNNGSLYMNNCTLAGNSVSGGSSTGGGIHVATDCLLEMTNSTIYDNHSVASSGGAIALQNTARAYIMSSTIAGNSAFGATNPGGGIHSNGANLRVYNSIVLGNYNTLNPGPGPIGQIMPNDIGILSGGSAYLAYCVYYSVNGSFLPIGTNYDSASIATELNARWDNNNLKLFSLDGEDLLQNGMIKIMPGGDAARGGTLLGRAGSDAGTYNWYVYDNTMADPKQWRLQPNSVYTPFSTNPPDYGLALGGQDYNEIETTAQNGVSRTGGVPDRFSIGAYGLELSEEGTTVTTNLDVVAEDSRISLREAITNAEASGNPVKFSETEFTPGGTVDSNTISLRLAAGPLVIGQGITIEGLQDNGGNPFITVKVPRTYYASEQANMPAIASKFRVFEVEAAGGTVTMENLIVKGGDVSMDGANPDGGSIYANGATLALDNMEISEAKAQYGGGLYIENGDGSAITGSTVRNNAAGNGGGIYIAGSKDVAVSDNIIEENKAQSNGAGVAADGSVDITENTFASNTAQGNGGGAYVAYDLAGPATADDAAYIAGNSFDANSAADGGGLYFAGNGPIYNNVFHANTASGDGGGAYVYAKANTRPLFAANTAAGNNCGDGKQGAGVYTAVDGGASLDTVSNVLVGNFKGADPTASTATDKADFYGAGAGVYLDYSIIGDYFAGSGFAPEDMVGLSDIATELGAVWEQVDGAWRLTDGSGTPVYQGGSILVRETSKSASGGVLIGWANEKGYYFKGGSGDWTDAGGASGGTFVNAAMSSYGLTDASVVADVAQNAVNRCIQSIQKFTAGACALQAKSKQGTLVSTTTDWESNPFSQYYSLRELVNRANAGTGGTVQFDSGVFYIGTGGAGTIELDPRFGDIEITKNITIQGLQSSGAPFITVKAATTYAEAVEASPAQYDAVVSRHRVFAVGDGSAAGVTATIQSLILQGGDVSGVAGDDTGGTILLVQPASDTTTLNLQDVTVKDSCAKQGGGIALAADTVLNATDCAITNAAATMFDPMQATVGNGGAMYGAAGSTVNTDQCTIYGNSSKNDGGAVYLDGGGNFINTTFYDNHTTHASLGSGGAMYIVPGARVVLADSTFAGNYTTNPSGDTGGVHIASNAGDVDILNNLFVGNYKGAHTALSDLNATAGGANLVYNVIGSPLVGAGTTNMLDDGTGAIVGIGTEFNGEWTAVDGKQTIVWAGGTTPIFDGATMPVTILSKSAYCGALVGHVTVPDTQDAWYVKPGLGKYWLDNTGATVNDAAFQENGSDNYGLTANASVGTAATVYTYAQNQYSGADASRVSTDVSYTAGAYALTQKDASVIVNVNADSTNYFDTDVTLREAAYTASILGQPVQFDTSVFYAGGADNTITLQDADGYRAVNLKRVVEIDASGLVGADGAPLITVKVSSTYDEAGDSASAFSVFDMDAGAQATIANLDIRGGKPVSGAGGINMGDDATLELEQVTIADTYKALIITNGSALTAEDCIFNGNGADSGGVIDIAAGSVSSVFTDCIFEGNNGYDGGVINNASKLWISGGVFNENRAGRSGGALYAGAATADTTIYNSTFHANNAVNTAGAVYAAGGTLIFMDNTVAGNTATDTGGVRLESAGTYFMGNNLLLGNYAGAASDITAAVAAYLDNAVYNIYGSASPDLAAGSFNTQSTIGAEFGAEWTGGKLVKAGTTTPVFDGKTMPIKADGKAAGDGTLTGYIDDGTNIHWYYRDRKGTADAWVSKTTGTTYPTNIPAPPTPAVSPYGLTGGTIINVAQNIGVSASPVSRTNYHYSYSAGAHAIAYDAPSTIVTTNLDVFDYADGVTSLREAVFYAEIGYGGASGVTFDATKFVTPENPTGFNTVTINSQVTLYQNISITGLVSGGEPFITIKVPVTYADKGAGTATASRVFEFKNDSTSGGQAKLEDLIIQGGEVTEGGAVYVNEDASVLLTNVIVEKSAGDDGGGIYTEGTLSLDGAIVRNNAAGVGGGLYVAAAADDMAIEDSSFAGNTATEGGAVYFAGNTGGSSRVVEDSAFTGNTAERGGAIYNGNNNMVTVAGSTFTGNTASTPANAGRGGAVYNTGTNTGAVVINSLLDGNQANEGGGLWMDGGDVDIRYTTLKSNTASTSLGGGAAVRGGVLQAVNDTFFGNTAPGTGENNMGGGLYVDGSATAYVADSTFTRNSSGVLAVGGTTLMMSSIATGNAEAAYDVKRTAGTVRLSYTVFGKTVGSGIDLAQCRQAYAQNVFGSATPVLTENNVVAITSIGAGAYTGTLVGEITSGANAGWYYRSGNDWVSANDPTTSTGLTFNTTGPAYGLTGGVAVADAQNIRTGTIRMSRVAVHTAYNAGAYALANQDPQGSLVVTTNVDTVNPFDGENSLREALEYAKTLYSGRNITFDQNSFDMQSATAASNIVTLQDKLDVTGTTTITGLKNSDGDALITVKVPFTYKQSGESSATQNTVLNITRGSEATATVGLQDLILKGGNYHPTGYGAVNIGAGVTATLTNVTVAESKGGILVGGTLNAVDSVISENTIIDNGGGGILATSTARSVNLENSIVEKNKAQNGGGVMAYVPVTAEQTVFSENQATDTSGNGGALWLNSSASISDNSQFTKNKANGSGGAIYIEDVAATTDVSITDSVFDANEANSGGAIAATRSRSVAIDNCDISNNIATTTGGAVVTGTNVNLNVIYTTLNANRAANGGAIYNNGSFTTVNSTYFENRATANGGGVFNAQAASIIDATFTKNTIGGIYTNGTTATTSIVNTISTGNTTYDVRRDAGAVYMAYSVYGVLIGTVDSLSNVTAASAAVFGSSALLDADGTVPILQDGPAAYSGTLAGSITTGGATTWYYRNGTVWTEALDPTTPTVYTFNQTAPSYGLTGGAGVQYAQNMANATDRMRRVDTHEAYCVGAHALSTSLKTPSTVVTVDNDSINPFSSKVSLREAIGFAGTPGLGDTITKAADVGAITLENDLPVNKDITIDDGFTIGGNYNIDVDPVNKMTFGDIVLNVAEVTGGSLVFTGTTAGSAVVDASATYSGTDNQQIYSGTYPSLTLTGSGNKKLNGNVTVTTAFQSAGTSATQYVALDGNGYTMNLPDYGTAAAPVTGITNSDIKNTKFGGAGDTLYINDTNSGANSEIRIVLNPTGSFTVQPITYGESLADSGVTATLPTARGIPVDGAYSFVNGATRPRVSDSDTTPYNVRFVPTDTTLYVVDPAYTPTSTITVNRKELAVGLSINSKVYDANTDATYAWGALSGIVSGDTVTYDASVIVVSFATPDAATGKRMVFSANDITLNGPDEDNYFLRVPTQTTGEVTPADIVWERLPAAGEAHYGAPLELTEITPGVARGVVNEVVGGVYTWANPDIAMNARGNFDAIFTPNSQNYKPTQVSLYVNVIETPLISPKPLPEGIEGMPYETQIISYGVQPVTFELVSGTLPEGLTMLPDGTITGRPLVPGTYKFVVRAVNSYGTDQKEMTLIVRPENYQFIELFPVVDEYGIDVQGATNGTAAKFSMLLIDGNVIPRSEYMIWDGSMYVKIFASYLDTLENGTYTITAVYTDGAANTKLTLNRTQGGGGTLYHINASAGKGGSISPAGNIQIEQGMDYTFYFTSDRGYRVAQVTVDGRVVKTDGKTYTFVNVSGNHTIHVTFAKGTGVVSRTGDDTDIFPYLMLLVIAGVAMNIAIGVWKKRHNRQESSEEAEKRIERMYGL